MLEDVLRKAILSDCVGRDFRGDFPSRAWAYINGKLYEARYGGADGEYHGFPIESPQGIPRDQDDLSEAQKQWLHRHCLRSADSGLLLPQACFYNDGRSICIKWTADEQESCPQMPGHFVESGLVRISPDEAQLSLREFVANVISRVESLDDQRVARMRANWKAIVEADPAEVEFCRAAGQMGMDPYQSSDWDPLVVSLLESGIGGDTERPIVGDFLKAVDLAVAVDVWKWVKGVENDLSIGKSPQNQAIAELPASNAATLGYQMARQVRDTAALGPGEPVNSIEAVARKLDIAALSFDDRNHLPSTNVRAVVGWDPSRRAVIAGPKPGRQDSLRFLEARGLFLAAWNCQHSARLITDAHTWDQRAARAFAAELLAPRKDLVADLANNSTGDVIGRIAEKYLVGARVVEHQLNNANVFSGVE
jgi:hypothetical protein